MRDHAPTRPTLVLLHGLELAGRRWAPRLAALSARYRVVAPDLPGFGGEAGAAAFSLERAVDAASSALGAAPAHVCGTSLGAAVALALALREPRRVASLVLCDAPPALPAYARLARRLYASLASDRALAERAARALAAGGPALAQAAREETARLGRRGVLAALRECDRTPAAALARVAVPTLVLAGAGGGLSRRAARAMAAAIPGAEIRTVPGEAATCDLSHPGAFDAALADFIAAVEHRTHDEHDHVGCAMCN